MDMSQRLMKIKDQIYNNKLKQRERSMKKLAIALLMGIMCSGAMADEWMHIGDLEKGSVSVNIYEIPHESYMNTDYIGSWVTLDYFTPLVDKDISDSPMSQQISLQWHDCSSRKVSDFAELAYYDDQGNLLNNGSRSFIELRFTRVIPNTMESQIQTAVCILALSEEINKIKDNSMKNYYFKKLEEEYPYYIKLLMDYADSAN